MSSLYAKLIAVIEQKITPMAGAIGQQKYVTSIRDGFITALPFMIVGSFLLVFIFPAVFPDTTWGFARAWLQFSLDHRDALMLPFNFSMGVMTLFIAVGIAASLAKHHNLDSLTAGMLSLMSFLLVAAPLKDGQISTAYFSGQGSSPQFWWRFTLPSCTPSSSATILRSVCRLKCRRAWRARLRS